MTIFNFTLRAEDDRGAFSDRQFSIKVRNTLVDRYMVVDGTHAYTSLDMVNWTERPDMGGVGCAYGGGNWMVWQGDNRYRMSPDGINWTQHVAQYMNGATKTNVPGTITSKPVWMNDRWYATCGTTATGVVVIASDNGIIWEIIATNVVALNAAYNMPRLTTANNCLVINFHNQTSNTAVASINYPMISFDNGAKWEVAIKSTPAGLIPIVAHYSPQTVYRSSVLTFINGLWYYGQSVQRSYYSTYNANSQGARYHYVGYSHDLVNFTRCDTDEFTVTGSNTSAGMGGVIDDIHYANGVLLLSTTLPVNLASANPNFTAYSVDGRSFSKSTMTPINFHNTTYFLSQGKIYQCAGNTNTLRSSSNNGRNFTEIGTMPSASINDFARI